MSHQTYDTMADTDLIASNMNYTIVINGFVWAGCMIYYFIFARHWYTGPQMTVGENTSTVSDNTIGSSVAAGLSGNESTTDCRKED